ncbi:hypothetical protein Tco_0364317 [Tanacetum coccineum]
MGGARGGDGVLPCSPQKLALHESARHKIETEPPFAAINFRRRKRGRHQESQSETRLLSETAATISTVVPKRYSCRRPNLFLFVLKNTAVATVQESDE